VEDTTWANHELGLRLSIDGAEAQAVLMGTPKPVRVLTQKDREPLGLLHRPGTVITRGHTDENLENLARTFRERVVEPLRGTRLGRQELAAEILEDVAGALFKREWLDAARVLEAPRTGYRRTVIGLDPAELGNRVRAGARRSSPRTSTTSCTCSAPRDTPDRSAASSTGRSPSPSATRRRSWSNAITAGRRCSSCSGRSWRNAGSPSGA
jgi:phage terminase large subunit-like protein